MKTVQVLANAKATDVEGWGRTGMRAIADGKVAVIIMAGYVFFIPHSHSHLFNKL